MKPARKHNRLPGFDYSREEIYFVTCCVQDMACVFGDVVEGEMHLNAFGHIAEEQWHVVMGRYPFVYSHAFVVMPNHVHGLVEINLQWDQTGLDQECGVQEGAGTRDQECGDQECGDQERVGTRDQECGDQECGDQECAGTGRALSVRDLPGQAQPHNKNVERPKVLSLSQLVGAYKTISSKLIRGAGMPDFTWKRSFYDHIVRNEIGYRHIKNYIESNPSRWHEDKFRK